MSDFKTLVLITGATGVGKTELCLSLAERIGSPIISADSRQIYREIPIGTAAPTKEEQERVKHYFVGTKSVTEDYNAGQYERDCLQVLDDLFRDHDTLLMTGGSMMYIDAVCNGLDDIPEVEQPVRQAVQQAYKEQGIEWLQSEVERLDPVYWQEVDRQNPQRLMHCVEVSMSTGRPYSSFREGKKRERPFNIVKICLNRDRDELYDRINKRVIKMIDGGLIDEVKKMLPYRHLNSLNTVGYKEVFRYLDGEISIDEAVRQIQQNSRHYAKRQLTWFRADKDIKWIDITNNQSQNVNINNVISGLYI